MKHEFRPQGYGRRWCTYCYESPNEKNVNADCKKRIEAEKERLRKEVEREATGRQQNNDC